MGKARRGDKERSKEQELKYENREFRRRERDKDHEIKQLRREVGSLRKQLARIDLDRYAQVRDIVEEHYANEEVEQNTQDMMASLKSVWKCHECADGHLEINIFSKMGEPWYFRHCNNCDNRTKSQVYTPNVKGIVKTAPVKDIKK